MNGREKLIEATRIYLQSNRKMTLTRTEIAQGCGVTPALISYYFKDKRSLLDAVTKPVLKVYSQRLDMISASIHSPQDKMRAVIGLLIDLNANDSFLVGFMVHQGGLDELDAEDRGSIQAFQSAIGTLVRALVAEGAWTDADPALSELALWGLCRAVGEALHAAAQDGTTPGRADETSERVNFIYDMFAVPGGELAR